MRCISPLTIRRDGSRHVVPCGSCNYCLSSKRSDWSFRLMQEMKVSSSAFFLTLTYADSLQLSLDKTHVQLFKKRLRKAHIKAVDAGGRTALRYFTAGEYGTVTDRPHYHAILFNLCGSVLEDVQNIWGRGYVHVGKVNAASIHYVTKYVINRFDSSGREPPFSLMSRRPGLGVNYVDTHKKWHKKLQANFTNVNGQIGRLPRFLKEKIFTKLERSFLAVEAAAYSDSNYVEEIARLGKFHSDPYAYYDERVAHSHDVIVSKSNSSNKF